MTVRELQRVYGMRQSWPSDAIILLSHPTQTLRFRINSRESVINGTVLWLNGPVTVVRGQWALEQADVALVVDPILRPRLYLRPYRAAVVLLDPGHGGKDTGAISPTGLLEKELTLDIARRVRMLLVNAGFRVHMTRDSDRFVELPERTAMIARTGADLFVSIHLNSANDPLARGVETYLLPARGFQSTHAGGGRATSAPALNGHRHAAANAILAHALHRQLRQQTGLPDRGIRHAHYAVLKNATCPAALVECGFLSNALDETYLRSEAGRERIAQAIAGGIRWYARAVESARAPE